MGAYSKMYSLLWHFPNRAHFAGTLTQNFSDRAHFAGTPCISWKPFKLQNWGTGLLLEQRRLLFLFGQKALTELEASLSVLDIPPR